MVLVSYLISIFLFLIAVNLSNRWLWFGFVGAKNGVIIVVTVKSFSRVFIVLRFHSFSFLYRSLWIFLVWLWLCSPLWEMVWKFVVYVDSLLCDCEFFLYLPVYFSFMTLLSILWFLKIMDDRCLLLIIPCFLILLVHTQIVCFFFLIPSLWYWFHTHCFTFWCWCDVILSSLCLLWIGNFSRWWRFPLSTLCYIAFGWLYIFIC